MIMGIEYGLTLDLQEAAPPWPLEVGLERQHARVPDTPKHFRAFPAVPNSAAPTPSVSAAARINSSRSAAALAPAKTAAPPGICRAPSAGTGCALEPAEAAAPRAKHLS